MQNLLQVIYQLYFINQGQLNFRANLCVPHRHRQTPNTRPRKRGTKHLTGCLHPKFLLSSLLPKLGKDVHVNRDSLSANAFLSHQVCSVSVILLTMMGRGVLISFYYLPTVCEYEFCKTGGRDVGKFHIIKQTLNVYQ